MPLRWIMYLLKAPFNLYILQNETINISYAIKLFGITYSYVPFIIIFALSLITKKDFNVFGIVSFSILLPTVLYQYHSLSEHLIAIQIFWLFLAFNGVHQNYKYKSIINSFFIFILLFTHPVSAFLFIFWGILNLFSYIKKSDSEYLKNFSFYFIIGVIRFTAIYFTRSDQETASVERLTTVFLDMMFLNKQSLICFFLIPISFLMALKSTVIYRYSLLISGFLFFLYVFFNIQEQVISIIVLRYLQFIIHIPFFILFYKKFILNKRSPKKTDSFFIIFSSFTFMSIVTTMAVARSYSINKVINYYLSRNIQCIESEEVNKKFNTLPFGHFATPFEITLHQKNLSPEFIILTKDSCSELNDVKNAWINLYTARRENIYPTINLRKIIKSSHD